MTRHCDSERRGTEPSRITQEQNVEESGGHPKDDGDRLGTVSFKRYKIDDTYYLLDPVRERLYRRIMHRDNEYGARIIALSDAVWYMGYLKTVHVASDHERYPDGVVLLQEPRAGIVESVAPTEELERIADCIHYEEVETLR